MVWDPERPREDPPSPPRRFTIAAAGDVLIHMPLANQARAYGTEIGADHDFAPMFAEIRAALGVPTVLGAAPARHGTRSGKLRHLLHRLQPRR